MDNHERIRLLLVDGDEIKGGRGGRISHGAAAVVSRWPGYIASVIWSLICLISIILLLMLMIYTLVVREERRFNIGGRKPAEVSERTVRSYKLNNNFCKEMTQNRSTILGEIKKESPKIEVLNSEHNIFYVRTKPLSKHSSCAVESILKYGKTKTIYIMMFDKYKLVYENLLKDNYKNLILNQVNGEQYLRRSPFQWKHEDKNKSMIAAGLITVWQFGGTIMSDNLMACKRIVNINRFDLLDGSCVVDYELLSCNEQCAAFVYDFIQELVGYNMTSGAGPIIDKSIAKFCNGQTDCEGARMAANICNEPTLDSRCEFARLDAWIEVDPTWETIFKHCPVTGRYAKSLPNNTDSEVTSGRRKGNFTTLPTKATSIVTKIKRKHRTIF
ncbi:hypothetical protein O3M35_002049 [Rhynocoris fuscipes]|uniref:Uncharacterized protein n=1 Tax=Rhynocoris fuscipes TaxID=488301 RepID=A0AAW1CTQ1_9HEMI